MKTRCWVLWVLNAATCLVFLASQGVTQEPQAPKGLDAEQSLPSRYEYVVQDMLKYCQPRKGCWVDLGAGQGQVALELIAATGNPVVMVDPDTEAMAKGLAAAREKHVEDRLFAVTGCAESLPFPDNSVDFVASRGSIFFWDDPVKGLQEVRRVLRPGGKAYIGGGAGSGYPASAVAELIRTRQARLQGDEAERWQRFVALREPGQMQQWAADAGLEEFEVLGQGAISADDPHVGQGVWLMFEKKPARIPVILDTDIGGDIDDTWALALLLKSPELDVKLVVSDMGDTVYRAKIIAKMLETAKRTDIPIGIGVRQTEDAGPQAPWVADYNLEQFPGTVHQDGVAALIDTIMNAPAPMTLICIGPMPNIKVALEREPRIAQRARFVGMHGSVRLGYGGKSTPAPEWNVVGDVAAARSVFTAQWPMTITPLDTCGLVTLSGQKYRRIADATDPLTRAVIENYRIWRKAGDPNATDTEEASSVLFDTVAIYLAFAQELVTLEELPLVVTDDGHTRIDPQGKQVTCAMAWKDLARFEDFLVDRLTGTP